MFDDYAIVDRHSQSFFIGSLSRMVHAGSHGRQEYKRPVAYDDPKRESITCYFQVYQMSKRMFMMASTRLVTRSYANCRLLTS